MGWDVLVGVVRFCGRGFDAPTRNIHTTHAHIPTRPPTNLNVQQIILHPPDAPAAPDHAAEEAVAPALEAEANLLYIIIILLWIMCVYGGLVVVTPRRRLAIFRVVVGVVARRGIPPTTHWSNHTPTHPKYKYTDISHINYMLYV